MKFFVPIFYTYREISRQIASRWGGFIDLNDSATIKMGIQIYFIFSDFLKMLRAVWMSSRLPIHDCWWKLRSLRSLVIKQVCIPDLRRVVYKSVIVSLTFMRYNKSWRIFKKDPHKTLFLTSNVISPEWVSYGAHQSEKKTMFSRTLILFLYKFIALSKIFVKNYV